MPAATTDEGVEGSEFVKPKVVEKVFNLPLVTDTYDSLAKFSSPLHPYMEKAGSIASPVVDRAFTFKAGIESMTPEMIQTGYNSAKGQVCSLFLLLFTTNDGNVSLQVVAVAASVDASLCSGVDSLVDKVPALKQATPALYNSTK